MNIILIYFSIKYKGDWDQIYKALENKEKVELKEIEQLEQMMKENDWKCITIIDEEYPNQLKQAYKPPFVIWIKGDRRILSSKLISVTGNQMDNKSEERLLKFIPEIEKSHNIVASRFKGIDQAILERSKKGKLYVLPNGVDQVNFDVNKDDLLLSEYPFDVKPSKERYRNRNRLIAAFAKSLILITSEKNGPINNLITNFLNLGKEVYCFPGDGTENDGNSELIKQGANLITTIKDISN